MKLTDKYSGMLKGESAMPPYFFALVPLGWAYSAVMRARAFLYRSGLLAVKKLPCRVVSIGNLTAGGTGKTPMVAHVVNMLNGMGLNVAVLTRGYGGTREGETLVVADGTNTLLSPAESGDEPALLAGLLPGVPVVMGPDRHRAGLLAYEKFRPDVVVLDDGYQHMRLHRDLNILLMDARRPFGNGRVIPAGYLREPVSAAGRADLIVLTRSGGMSGEELDGACNAVSDAAGGRPVTTSDHSPVSLVPVWGGTPEGPEKLSGRDVYAFCGIAGPASFALILKRLGAKIIKLKSFSDHHDYSDEELSVMESEAAGLGAEIMVTTAKDAVKLAGLKRTGLEAFYVGIEAVLGDGGRMLGELLGERIIGR